MSKNGVPTRTNPFVLFCCKEVLFLMITKLTFRMSSRLCDSGRLNKTEVNYICSYFGAIKTVHIQGVQLWFPRSGAFYILHLDLRQHAQFKYRSSIISSFWQKVLQEHAINTFIEIKSVWAGKHLQHAGHAGRGVSYFFLSFKADKRQWKFIYLNTVYYRVELCVFVSSIACLPYTNIVAHTKSKVLVNLMICQRLYKSF